MVGQRTEDWRASGGTNWTIGGDYMCSGADQHLEWKEHPHE